MLKIFYREYFLENYFWRNSSLLLPFFHNKFCEAGLDEAGRGCFAGPVFAAAVILPKDFYHPALNDSKQMKKEDREMLRPLIEKAAIAWSVAKVDNNEIDRINILQASFKAMHLSLNKLQYKPDYLLVDGNRFKKYKQYPHRCVVQGDGMYTSIAAASVLAKTYRDDYMQRLHKKFKMYAWESNKGYGTQEHRTAIEKHGLCKYHRLSFNIFSPKPIEESIDDIDEKTPAMQPIRQDPAV